MFSHVTKATTTRCTPNYGSVSLYSSTDSLLRILRFNFFGVLEGVVVASTIEVMDARPHSKLPLTLRFKLRVLLRDKDIRTGWFQGIEATHSVDSFYSSTSQFKRSAFPHLVCHEYFTCEFYTISGVVSPFTCIITNECSFIIKIISQLFNKALHCSFLNTF